jgi:hypothetical protein
MAIEISMFIIQFFGKYESKKLRGPAGRSPAGRGPAGGATGKLK